MTLVRYADYVRPTDGTFAFRLREPAARPSGTRFDVREVARAVLLPDDAARFEAKVSRWDGPDDERDGKRPWAQPQLFFEFAESLSLGTVMSGTAQVLKRKNGFDYVLRDHHMVDVVLLHYWLTGELPARLFHADRHSDWCKDSYLEARTPPQAATWWKLLEGVKRLDGTPVLAQDAVLFTLGKGERTQKMSGRDFTFPVVMPSGLEPAWQFVSEKLEPFACDWASIDLDNYQPWPQLKATRGLLRDARFTAMLRAAKVRVFCLSPQFTNGGDKIDPWVSQGSLSSSARLLRWFLGH